MKLHGLNFKDFLFLIICVSLGFISNSLDLLLRTQSARINSYSALGMLLIWVKTLKYLLFIYILKLQSLRQVMHEDSTLYWRGIKWTKELFLPLMDSQRLDISTENIVRQWFNHLKNCQMSSTCVYRAMIS